MSLSYPSDKDKLGLLPLKFAAASLQISLYKLQQIIKSGRLATVVLAGKRFVRQSDVEHLLDENTSKRAAVAVLAAFGGSWQDAVRTHRLPISSANRYRKSLCAEHYLRDVEQVVGRTGECQTSWAATWMRHRHLLRSGEQCAQCRGGVPGVKARRLCTSHWYDVMLDNSRRDAKGSWITVQTLMKLAAYAYVGAGNEHCEQCLKDDGVLPIGKRIATGVLKHDLN